MARLFADENFPLPSVEELRRLGNDIATLPESGQASKAMPDDEILAQATAAGRAVLPMNRRHFVRLHKTTPSHSGIVVCSFDVDFEALADRVHRAIAEHGELEGELIRVHRPG